MKPFGTSFVVVLALLLLAPVAHATTIVEDGFWTGTENGAAVLTGTLAVTCDTSTLLLNVADDGTATIDNITWAACTSGLGACTVTLDAKPLAMWITFLPGMLFTGGEMTLNKGVTGTATVSCGIATCTAVVDTTFIATVTETSFTTKATVDLAGQDVGMPGGICGALATWTQSWTVNSTASGLDTTVTIT